MMKVVIFGLATISVHALKHGGSKNGNEAVKMSPTNKMLMTGIGAFVMAALPSTTIANEFCEDIPDGILFVQEEMLDENGVLSCPDLVNGLNQIYANSWTNLTKIDLPLLESLDGETSIFLHNTQLLPELYLPSLKRIEGGIIISSDNEALKEINLPNVEVIDYINIFVTSGFDPLEKISMPNLKRIGSGTFGAPESPFWIRNSAALTELDFSSVAHISDERGENSCTNTDKFCLNQDESNPWKEIEGMDMWCRENILSEDDHVGDAAILCTPCGELLDVENNSNLQLVDFSSCPNVELRVGQTNPEDCIVRIGETEVPCNQQDVTSSD